MQSFKQHHQKFTIMKRSFHIVRASYGKTTSHISTHLDGPFATKQVAQEYLYSAYSSLVTDFAGKVVSCSFDFYLDSYTIETKYCIHEAKIF